MKKTVWLFFFTLLFFSCRIAPAHAVIDSIYYDMDKCRADGNKVLGWSESKQNWEEVSERRLANLCSFSDGTVCELTDYVSGKCSSGKYKEFVLMNKAYNLPDLVVGNGGLNFAGAVNHNPTHKNIHIVPEDSPYFKVFSEGNVFLKYFPFEWQETEDATYYLAGVSVCNQGFAKSNPALLKYNGAKLYDVPSLNPGKCQPVSIVMFFPLSDESQVYKFTVENSDSELSKQNNVFSFSVGKKDGFKYLNKGGSADASSDDMPKPFYVTVDNKMVYYGESETKDLITYPIQNQPETVLPEPLPVVIDENDPDIQVIKAKDAILSQEEAAKREAEDKKFLDAQIKIRDKFSKELNAAVAEEKKQVDQACTKQKGQIMIWKGMWVKDTKAGFPRICKFSNNTVCQVRDLYEGRCRSGEYKHFYTPTEAVMTSPEYNLPDLQIFKERIGDEFSLAQPSAGSVVPISYSIVNKEGLQNSGGIIKYFGLGATSTLAQAKYVILGFSINAQFSREKTPATVLKLDGNVVYNIKSLSPSQIGSDLILVFVPVNDEKQKHEITIENVGKEVSRENNSLAFTVSRGEGAVFTNGTARSLVPNDFPPAYYLTVKGKKVPWSNVQKKPSKLKKTAAAVIKKYSGKILKTADSLEEGWYVNPADGRRYFFGLGYNPILFKKVGIKVSLKELAKIPFSPLSLPGYAPILKDPLNKPTSTVDMKIAKKYSGQILLLDGKTNSPWYINPKDNKRYFLGENFWLWTALADKLKTVVAKSELNKIQPGSVICAPYNYVSTEYCY